MLELHNRVVVFSRSTLPLSKDLPTGLANTWIGISGPGWEAFKDFRVYVSWCVLI